MFSSYLFEFVTSYNIELHVGFIAIEECMIKVIDKFCIVGLDLVDVGLPTYNSLPTPLLCIYIHM